jgi:hypothetical protein
MTAALHVASWSLATLGLGLQLITPNANGPLLVLLWAGGIATFRILASMVAGRIPRLVVATTFVWLCFMGAFWGGWIMIPAGIAFILYDWRTDARGLDPRLLTTEVPAAAASAVSGFVALALLVATQPAGSIRDLLEPGPDGIPMYRELEDLATLGPLTDRLDVAVALVGALLGLLVVAAVGHALTSSRLAFLAMCASVLGVGVFAGLASLSAGLWFVPAVALGVVACVAGWRGRGRAPEAARHREGGRSATGLSSKGTQ